MFQSKKVFSQVTTLFFSSFLFILTSCGNQTVDILMQSTSDSNEINAVQIVIYQLKSSEKFLLANRESLIRTPEETLGEDLVANSKVQKIMIPGEIYKIEDIEISQESKLIGIVGDFFSPAQDSWSQLIDITQKQDNIKVIIGKNFLTVTE